MLEDCRPNWAKWNHFHDVTVWQAVALWADIDPDLVRYDRVSERFSGVRGESKVEFLPVPPPLSDRLDIAISNLPKLRLQHVVSGRPAECEVILASFAALVCGFEYEVPAELLALAEPDQRQTEIVNLKWQVAARTEERDTWKLKAEETQKQLEAGRAHYSEKLVTLIQAATKFWANYHSDRRDTRTKNTDVVAWLTKKGFSPTLAEKAATIIRPESVPTGRPPEE